MITGGIYLVDVPSVAVGSTIKATVDYRATNPGALYWKTWLIYTSYQLSPDHKMLDETRETGSDGGRTKTYSLAPMPNSNVVIDFQLFASDQAAMSFDWGTWTAWMDGFGSLPAGMVYLGHEFAYLSPGTPPPPEYTLNVNVASPAVGYVTKSPDKATYAAGETVTLYAHLDSWAVGSYVFDHWGGDTSGTSPATTVYMNSNKNVTAYFKEVPAPPPPPPPEEVFSDLIITGMTSPVDIGGVCRVNVRFNYKGPAQTRQLYAAIGNSGWAGFDEILHGVASLSLPLTTTLTSRTASVNIPITTAIDPLESPFDLYVKINGAFPAISSPVYDNVVTITGGVPNEEFRNLRITNYTTPVKQGQICQVDVAFEYQGPAQSRSLYAALGNSGAFGFNEIVAGSSTLTVPETATLRTYYATVNIAVTMAISPDDSPYDLYAKINGAFPAATSPMLYDVVFVTGEPTPPDPEIRNFRITGFTSPVGLGDQCIVQVMFDYQGPAMTGGIHAAIGNSGAFGFDEILNGGDIISVPAAVSWQPCEAEVSITITAGLSAEDSPYDLYAKTTGALPYWFSPMLQDVLVVKASGGYPEYQNFRISDYESPVQLGGTCRITVNLEYRGPAVSLPLHVAIGNNGFFGFDEIISRTSTIELPATDSWTAFSFMSTVQVVDISIEDSPYDLYARIGDFPTGVQAPILNSVIGIEGGGPGAGDIVGSITSAVPLTFEAGQPVKVMVSYDAYTDNPETQIAWQTMVTIVAGSLQGEVVLDHFGPDTTQSAELNLGPMPEASQTGTVKLSGRPLDGEWAVLQQQAITISLPGEGPEPEGGVGALGWIALAAVAAIAIAGGGKEKKKPAKKRGTLGHG